MSLTQAVDQPLEEEEMEIWRERYDDDDLFEEYEENNNVRANSQNLPQVNNQEDDEIIQQVNQQGVSRPRTGNSNYNQRQRQSMINRRMNRQNENYQYAQNMENNIQGNGNRNNRNRRRSRRGRDDQNINNNNSNNVNVNNHNDDRRNVNSQTTNQIPAAIEQTLSQVQNNANIENFRNFYLNRKQHEPPPDPLLTQVSLNSGWTPAYTAQSQVPQAQLQNSMQPQVNLLTQGKNTYKILQPPRTQMSDPNVPVLQPIPDVYNMYTKIPNGQNLEEFQKVQALNRINTQEIKRHKQLFNQDFLKKVATLGYDERQAFVKANPMAAQSIAQANVAETLNQKRTLNHQAAWTAWQGNQMQLDRNPAIAQDANSYWLLQSLQNRGYRSLEEYNQNVMLTKRLKQSTSALPNYAKSVTEAAEPGGKEKKIFLGLRQLYQVTEEDENMADNLFQDYQIKKIRDLKKLSQVKLHSKPTALQYTTIRMMALAALKANLYLVSHLNKVIGQYNILISPATDPQIIKDQANRVLMMAANIDHIAWGANILLNEEMVKDEPNNEQLMKFIMPYFERYHMKPKPLHPEREFDCFLKQINLKKQLLELKKKPMKPQQTVIQKPKKVEQKPKIEEQINL